MRPTLRYLKNRPLIQHAILLPLISSIVLFSLLAATFAALAAAWFKRLPTLQFCPTCTHHTQAVLLQRWLKPLERWLSRRWCPDCEWEGLGRKGPEFVVGQKVAHDSGFHWGADLVGANSGFNWAKQEQLEPMAAPPDDRSGFRFAALPEPPAIKPPDFNWSGGLPDQPAPPSAPEPAQASPAHPAGFSWGTDQHEGGGPKGFQWKHQPLPDDRPKGFQWGGRA